MPTITVTCQVCQKEFEFKRTPSTIAKGAGKYCSRKCKGIASRQRNPKSCKVCGKTFQPFFNTSKRYCSSECGEIARRANRRTGKNVSCEWCNTEFYLPKFRLERSQHYFCSVTCLNEWQGRNKIEYTCKICGKAFKWSPSRDEHYNVTYCSLACRDKDPTRTRMLRKMNLQQQRLSPNSLERQGYAILDSLGLTYYPQELIADKFTVDAYLPGHNTIVQFDGDYWHGNPDKFQSLDHRQEKRVRLDQSQNAYFAKCGYIALRFWECDIKKRPEWVADQIATKLHLSQASPVPQEHTVAVLA